VSSINNQLKENVFDDDDGVNGVRLWLWTAATNRPIVHPPGDIWAWRTSGMRWQGKAHLSNRAPGNSTGSQLVAKQ
jgi:hypothetical protein